MYNVSCIIIIIVLVFSKETWLKEQLLVFPVSRKPHVLLLVIKLAFTSDGVINSMKSESE